MSGTIKKGEFFDKMSSLKDEQERVQKKTFTKWMNLYFSQLKPPVIVRDMFLEVKDGLLLLDLLEMLTKIKLVKERPKVMQRIHCINNVRAALEFMEKEKKIKMVNINPTDIVDGKPSIVLGLSWTLICFFQIEEQEKFLLQALGLDNDPNAKVKGMAKKALMAWSNNTLSDKYGLNLKDFGESWRDGKAFNALVHNINPDLIDMDDMQNQSNKDRLENAFNIAENMLGIPRLLDSEDVDVNKPDEKSIMTYVAQFLKSYPEGKKPDDVEEDVVDGRIIEKENAEIPTLNDWDILQSFNDNVNSYSKDPNQKKDYDMLFRMMDQQKEAEDALDNIKNDKLSNDVNQVKEAEDALEKSKAKLKECQWELDKKLPGDLGSSIAPWLCEAEKFLMEPLFDYHGNNIPDEIKNKLDDHKRIFGKKDDILRQLADIQKKAPLGVSLQQLEDIRKRVEDVINKEPERQELMDILLLQSKLNDEAKKWNHSLDDWATPIESKVDFEQRMTDFNASTDNGNPMDNFGTDLNDLIKKTSRYIKDNPHLEAGLDEFLKSALEHCESENDVLPSKFDSCCGNLEHISSAWADIDDMESKVQEFLTKMKNSIESKDIQQQKLLSSQLPDFNDLMSALRDKFEHDVKPYCSDALSREMETAMNNTDGDLQQVAEEMINSIEKQNQEEAMELQAFQEATIKNLVSNGDEIMEEINKWFSDIKKCVNHEIDPSSEKLQDVLENLEGLREMAPKMKDLIKNGYQLVEDLIKENSLPEAEKLKKLLDNLEVKVKECVDKELVNNIADIRNMIEITKDIEDGIKQLDAIVEEGNELRRDLENVTNPDESSAVHKHEKTFLDKEAEIANSIKKDKELLKKLKEMVKNSNIQFDVTPLEKKITMAEEELQTLIKSAESNLAAAEKCDSACNDAALSLDEVSRKLAGIKNNKNDETTQKETLNIINDLEKDLKEAEDKIEKAIEQKSKEKQNLSKAELFKIDSEIMEMRNNANDLKKKLKDSKNNLGNSLQKWNDFNDCKSAAEDKLDKLSKDLEKCHKDRNSDHGGDLDDKSALLEENQKRLKQLNDEEDEVDGLLKLANELNSAVPVEEAKKLKEKFRRQREDLENEIKRNQHDLDNHNHLQDSLSSFKDWIKEAEELKKEIDNTPNTKEGLLKKQKLLEKLNSLKSPGDNKLKDLKNLETNVLSETAPTSKGQISANVNKEFEKFNKIFGNLNDSSDDINETISKLEKLEERCGKVADDINVMNNDLETSLQRPRNTVADKQKIETDLLALCRSIDEQEKKVKDLMEQTEGLSDEAKEEMMLKLKRLEDELVKAHQHANEELDQNKSAIDKQIKLEDSVREADSFINKLEGIVQSCSVPATNESTIEENVTKLENLENELLSLEDMIECTKRQRNEAIPYLTKSELNNIDKKISDMKNNADTLRNDMVESKKNLEDGLNKWNIFNENKDQINKGLENISKELEEAHQTRKGIHGGDCEDKASLLEDNENRLAALQDREKEIENMILLAKELNSDIPIREAKELLKLCQEEKRNLENEISHNKKDLKDHQQFQDDLSSFRDWIKDVEELNNEIKNTANTKEGLLKKQNLLAKLDSLKAPGNNKLKDLKKLQNNLLNETAPDNKDQISSDVNNELTRFNNIFGDLDNSKEDINETLSKLGKLDETCCEMSESLKNVNDALEKSRQQPINTIADKEKMEKELARLSRLIDIQRNQVNDLRNQTDELSDEAKEEMIQKLEDIENQLNQSYQQINDDLAQNKLSIEQQLKLDDKLNKLDSFFNHLNTDITKCSVPANNEKNVADNLNKLEDLENDLITTEEMITNTMKQRDEAAPYLSQSELAKIDAKIDDMHRNANDLKKEMTESKKTLGDQLKKWNLFNDNKELVKEGMNNLSRELEQCHVVRKGVHGSDCDDKETLLRDNEKRLEYLNERETEIEELLTLAKELNSDLAMREAGELKKLCSDEKRNLEKEISQNRKDLEDHQLFEEELASFRDYIKDAEELQREINNIPNTKEGLLKKQKLLERLNNLKTPGNNKLKDLKNLQNTLLNGTAPGGKDLICADVNKECEKFNNIFGNIDNSKDDINETISKLQKLEEKCEELQGNMTDLHTDLANASQVPLETVADKDKFEKELNRLNRLMEKQKAEINDLKYQSEGLNGEASEELMLKLKKSEKDLAEMQQTIQDEIARNKLSMEQQSKLEDRLGNLDSFIGLFEDTIADCSVPTDNEKSVEENIRKLEKLKLELPKARSLLEEIIKCRNQFEPPEHVTKTCDDREQRFCDLEDEILNLDQILKTNKNNWGIFNSEKEDLENWVDSVSTEMMKLNDKNQGIHGGRIEDKEILLNAHRSLLQDVLNHEAEINGLIDRSTPLITSPNADSPKRITSSLCKKYEKLLENLTNAVNVNKIDLETHDKFEKEIEKFGTENNRIMKELNDKIANQPNNKDGIKKKTELYDEIRQIYNQRAKLLPGLENNKNELIEHSSPKAFQSIEQLWDKVIDNFEKAFSKANENQAKLLATVEALEKTESNCDEIENKLTNINNQRESCIAVPVSESDNADTKLRTLKDLQFELNELQSPIDQMSRKANDLPMLKDAIDRVKKRYKTVKDDLGKDISQYESTNRDLQNLTTSIKNLKTWLDHNRAQFQEQAEIDNVDTTSLRLKYSKLKILQDDIAEHKVDISRLQSQMEPIMKINHNVALKNTVDELSDEYKELHDQCQNCTEKYDNLMKLMSKYESCRASALHWIDNNTQLLLKCSEYNNNNSQIRSKLMTIENLEKDLELSGQLKFIDAVQSGEDLINELTGMGKNVMERQVSDLKSDWSEMCRQLNHLSNNLKATASRTDMFKETVNNLSAWLEDMEHTGMADSSAIDHHCQRPIDTIHKNAQFERVKTLQAEVERHRPDFAQLSDMAAEIGNPAFDLENSQMQTRFSKLQNHLKEKSETLDKQEADFDKVKQHIENIEKWIFQKSMQIINENTGQNDNNNPSSNGDADSVLEQNNEIIKSILEKEPEVMRIRQAALSLLDGCDGQPSDRTEEFKEDIEKMECNFNNLKSSAINKKNNLLDSFDKWKNYQRILELTKTFLDNDLETWWQDKERSSSKVSYLNKDKENELREIADMEQKVVELKREVEKAAQECEGIPPNITTSLSRTNTPIIQHNRFSSSQSPLHRSNCATPDKILGSRRQSLNAEQSLKPKAIFEQLEENLSKLAAMKKELQDKYADWNNFNREKSSFKNWFDNEVLKYKSTLQSSPNSTNIDSFQRNKLNNIQEEMIAKKPVLMNLLSRFAEINPGKPYATDPLLKDMAQEFERVEKDLAKLLNREDKEVEADFTEDDSKADIVQEVFVPKLSLGTERTTSTNGYKKQRGADFGCQTPSTKMTQTSFEDPASDTTEYSRPSSRRNKKMQLYKIANEVADIRHAWDQTRPISNRRPSPTSLLSRRIRTPNQESVRRNMIPSSSPRQLSYRQLPNPDYFNNNKAPYNPYTTLEISSPPSRDNTIMDDHTIDKWHDLEVFLNSTPRLSESIPKSKPNREFEVSYKPTMGQKSKKSSRSKINEELGRLKKDSQDLRQMDEKLKK